MAVSVVCIKLISLHVTITMATALAQHTRSE